MKRSLILLTAVLASTAALAQSAAPPADEGDHRGERHRERTEAKFTEADSNHDGNINQSEWQAASLRRASEQFKKLDGNRDGKLSHEEMAARQGMGGRGRGEHRERMRALDTDGDSQLSRAEIGNNMPRLAADFDRLDGNRDGKLSREEMRAGREQRKESVR